MVGDKTMKQTNVELLNIIRNNAHPDAALQKAVEITIAFLKLCESTEAKALASLQEHD